MARLSKQRQCILTEARTWIGTRWLHQGRVKRNQNFIGGVDCAGLIIEVGNALGLFPQPLYLHHYSRLPSGYFVHDACNEYLAVKPMQKLLPGDILLLRVHYETQHLALFTENKTLIHAYVPTRQVVEQRYDEHWQRRCVAVYSYPLLVKRLS